jgi:Uncharacterized conserved protein (DUF2285)
LGTTPHHERHKQGFRQSGDNFCYELRHAYRVEAKARPMTTPPFEDRAPASDSITAYDERHFITYLRLLDAADEGADWREVAAIVFGLDFEADPDRAMMIYVSHLKRARWMTEHGYRQLLEKSRNP